jgi:heme exporter protein B
VKTFLGAALTIAAKDLRVERRSKEVLNAAVSFALVVLLLFSFAFDPTGEETRSMSGGLLWLVFSFAGILVLNRSFARETVNDCLDALIAAPVSPGAVFFGKVLTNALLLLLLEMICIPVFGVFYNMPWTPVFVRLLPVLALGTWGFTVIGTVFSALTVNVRLRELMLPLLVFPITLPALMAAVRLTTVLFLGDPLAEELVWFRLLAGFDIIFTLLGLALVELVLVG